MCDFCRKNVRRRAHFAVAVLRILWIDIFRMLLCTFVYFACLFIKIPLMELIIDSCDATERFVSVLLYIATSAAEWLATCYQNELTSIFGNRILSLLRGTIFKKMSLLSPTARAANPPGYVLSILGVDCVQISLACYSFCYPLCGTLCFPVLLYLLYERVGAMPTLCCGAYLLGALLLLVPVTRLQNALWRRQMRARDERLKQTSDLLSSVRLVKMYAWEDAYQDKLLRARDAEMKPLFRINALDGIIDSVYSASSSLLIILLFGTLAIFYPERTLTAATSFACVSLLYITDVATSQFAMGLRLRSQVSLGLKRIVAFCTEEEMEDTSKDTDNKIPRKQGEVILEKCSFAWSKHGDGKASAGLRRVSLHVEAGSLVGVVGFVGSGKSSLLSGILGDMHCLEGVATCTGRVAYVPQLADVHNMSVRDNILFGKPMHARSYDRVLRGCQLLNDINSLPAGDRTEVGEKGETLSGGQKQRICLARAAYSGSDIYLLDDPLSALDPVVARKVFKEVLGKNGILRNRTRIMACNQGSFLHQMDKLVLVHNNTVTIYETLTELLEDPATPLTLRQGFSSSETESKKDVVARQSGWQLTCALMKMSGSWFGVGLVAFVASTVAVAWQLLWIKDWTNASSSDTGGSPDSQVWVWPLVAICLVDVFSRTLGSLLLALGVRRLSQLMHRRMASHVLRSPVSFFDSVPRGRILNRFAVDLDSIDSRMYLAGKLSVQNSLLAISKLAVVGTQAPVVLISGAVSVVLMAFTVRLALKASLVARFRESYHLSRALSHVTETMDSLSSIRGYGVLERFCRHFCRLVDDTMRSFACFAVCYRLVRLVTSFSGFFVILCTVLLVILLAPDAASLDPSTMALALSAASSVPQTLVALCNMLFTSLQTVVSFERCLEYTQLPGESDVEPEAKRQSMTALAAEGRVWPSGGQVEFDCYAASYKPGILPDVLKDVSFTVWPTERVGVVGRTGAGKSSLVLALLRVLKSSRGCIRIDGVDIAGVPLQTLRSVVTVIPQDPILVRGTLRENLDPTGSHTDEEIWAALEQSYLKEVVERNPEKLLLDTGDGGSNLSVGQRQLACLTRALLRRPRLLLLDEATSQMDGDTDRLIQVTLRTAFAHCTLITIAHRIHTVLDYDKILVMGDGRVLEFGPVADLLANPDSVFRNMAQDALLTSDAEAKDSVTSL
ncbi:ATP-binding cassette sub-family C member 2 [Ixodes scapularis]|uniref:ATP-binding cassette sub-family C member 2 n=1 Tax=Ixodes scapularis TaxID=6945 RepID=UPI001C38E76A|nr:ATP-binding cassette sub-family C member 2 [Ixodes scapularis]